MEKTIKSACYSLLRGGIIALPTETVYGLAVDAANPEAIAALYAFKGRGEDKPFQIMVPDIAMAEQLAVFSPLAEKIASAFLPGPLTLVLERRETSLIHADAAKGQKTIGIRIPNHPVVEKLLREYGKPIAATSANLSGQPPLKDVKEVEAVFGQKLGAILVGECTSEIPSTVVKISGDALTILRPGEISESDLRGVL